MTDYETSNLPSQQLEADNGSNQHEVGMVKQGVVPYPIQNYYTCSNLSSSYKEFVCCADTFVEPRTFEEAIKDQNWKTTMKDEIKALELNHTWDIVELSEGEHPIGCKWVYKIKYDSNDK